MAAVSKTLAALAALVLVAFVGLAPHGAEATSAPLALVTGVVPCSAGSSINVAAAPAFPNAGVKLMCRNRMLAAATTDNNGTFTMNLGKATQSMLTPMLTNQCKVVVDTPLSACNVSLSSVTGTLVAPVQLLGADSGSASSGALGGLGGLIGLIVGIIGGLLGGIINIVPTAFSVV